MQTELTGELQLLLEENAIRRLLATYSRAVDRRDWDLLATVYHEGATDHHGIFDGSAEDFVEWLRTFPTPPTFMMHFIGNQVIEIDGDKATAETYCLAMTRRPQSVTQTDVPMENCSRIRYCDQLEKRDGRWGIVDRTAVYDPGWTYAIEDAQPVTDTTVQGIPGMDDYIYSLQRL
jgi:hypothetical protein